MRGRKDSRGGTGHFPERGGSRAEAGPPFTGLPWGGLEWARAPCPVTQAAPPEPQTPQKLNPLQQPPCCRPQSGSPHGGAPELTRPKAPSPAPCPPGGGCLPLPTLWSLTSMLGLYTAPLTHKHTQTHALQGAHTRMRTQLASADGSGCWDHACPGPSACCLSLTHRRCSPQGQRDVTVLPFGYAPRPLLSIAGSMKRPGIPVQRPSPPHQGTPV